jgi:uncharacterized membrane protein
MDEIKVRLEAQEESINKAIENIDIAISVANKIRRTLAISLGLNAFFISKLVLTFILGE